MAFMVGPLVPFGWWIMREKNKNDIKINRSKHSTQINRELRNDGFFFEKFHPPLQGKENTTIPTLLNNQSSIPEFHSQPPTPTKSRHLIPPRVRRGVRSPGSSSVPATPSAPPRRLSATPGASATTWTLTSSWWAAPVVMAMVVGPRWNESWVQRLKEDVRCKRNQVDIPDTLLFHHKVLVLRNKKMFWAVGKVHIFKDIPTISLEFV